VKEFHTGDAATGTMAVVVIWIRTEAAPMEAGKSHTSFATKLNVAEPGCTLVAVMPAPQLVMEEKAGLGLVVSDEIGTVHRRQLVISTLAVPEEQKPKKARPLVRGAAP